MRVFAFNTACLISCICMMACHHGTAPHASTPKPFASSKPPSTNSLARTPNWIIQAPQSEWAITVRIALGDEQFLLLGKHGERWQDEKGAAGGLKAARFLTPEPLVGARRLDDGSWVFLGQSSRVYQAASALGELTEAHAPARSAYRAAVGKASFLVLSQQRELFRSVDAGATWKEIALPESGFTPVDLALDAAGHGAVLASPERLFATFDDGATFERLATDAGELETVNLTWDGRVEVAASRVLGDAFEIMGPPAARRLVRPHRPWKYGTSRTVVSNALAFGDYFAFVAQPEGENGQRKQLAVGRFGQKPKFHDVPEFDTCQKIFLSGFNNELEIGCVASNGANDPDSLHLQLFRTQPGRDSVDPDGTVESISPELLATLPEGPLWLGPNGWLFVHRGCHDSVCPPILLRPNWQAGLAPALNFEHVEPISVAFDEGNQRALLLLRQENADAKVWQWTASEAEPSPLKLDELDLARLNDANRYGGSVNFDPGVGVILVLPNGVYFEHPKAAGPGSSKAAHFLSVELDGHISLVGRHGLTWKRGTKTGLQETFDHGLTWQDATSPFDTETTPSCSRAGCVFSATTTMRVGFAESPSGEQKAAISEEIASAIGTPELARPAVIQCEAIGSPQPVNLSAIPSAYDLEPTAQHQLVQIVQNPNGATALEFVANDPNRSSLRLPLFASRSMTSRARVEFIRRSDALLAIRYDTLPRRKDQKAFINLELAWFIRNNTPDLSAIHHANIAQVSLPETWSPSSPLSLQSALRFAIGEGGVLIVGPTQMDWVSVEGVARSVSSNAFNAAPFDDLSTCSLLRGDAHPRLQCASGTAVQFFQFAGSKDLSGWVRKRSIQIAPPNLSEHAQLELAHWGSLPGVVLMSREDETERLLFAQLSGMLSPPVVYPIPISSAPSTWTVCGMEERSWPRLTIPVALRHRPYVALAAGRLNTDFGESVTYSVKSLVVHTKDAKACVSSLYASAVPGAFGLMDTIEQSANTTDAGAVLIHPSEAGNFGTFYEMAADTNGRATQHPLRCRTSR